MSKKNSSVILKNSFESPEELSYLYSEFSKKLNSFKKKSFLVAVSGGPDSLALTALSKVYSIKNKNKIAYALVDHNLRANSSREAKSVKNLLKKYKISLAILKNRKLIKKNIQSNAREVRYELLSKYCQKKKIKTILTAHNLEDQVETFFIRLSRGSGLQGLSSMKQVDKINEGINLARPLLNFKKIQLIKISKTIFGKFYNDPTNKNQKYLRTRIRNLKNKIEESGISYDKIFKSIQNLASSRDTLNLYFDKVYKEIVSRKKEIILIDLKSFNKLNLEMKMRTLSQAIKKLTNAYYALRSKKIFYLISKIKADGVRKTTLGGCLISSNKNCIILKKEKKIAIFE